MATLAALKAAAEAATVGPWRAEIGRGRANGSCSVYKAHDPTNERGMIANLTFGKQSEIKADATLIALCSPDTILALVEAAEALEILGSRSLDDPTDWCCCGGGGVYDYSEDSGHAVYCRQARAALAKLNLP